MMQARNRLTEDHRGGPPVTLSNLAGVAEEKVTDNGSPGMKGGDTQNIQIVFLSGTPFESLSLPLPQLMQVRSL
jgi:hypothetical protein